MPLGRHTFTGKIKSKLLSNQFKANVVVFFTFRTLGSLTNNGHKLANFAGFYRGIQSAGAAVVWRLDSVGTPYMDILASCWALLGGSLLIALPVILFKIKNHSTLADDLKFANETLQNVASGVLLEQDCESGPTRSVEKV